MERLGARAWWLDGKARVCLVRVSGGLMERLSCAWCARRLEGEGSRVLVLAILLEGCLLVRGTLLEGSLLVRGAHDIVAAYVQDILGACTKIAKARCASTTLKL